MNKWVTGGSGEEEGNINWAEQCYRTLNAKCPRFFTKSFRNFLAWSTLVSCQLFQKTDVKTPRGYYWNWEPTLQVSHSRLITCKNVTISLEQASRLILRTVTYSPTGLYLARFTVIRSSNPLPKRKEKCHKQGQEQHKFSSSLKRLDFKRKFKLKLSFLLFLDFFPISSFSANYSNWLWPRTPEVYRPKEKIEKSFSPGNMISSPTLGRRKP